MTAIDTHTHSCKIARTQYMNQTAWYRRKARCLILFQGTNKKVSQIAIPVGKIKKNEFNIADIYYLLLENTYFKKKKKKESPCRFINK